MPRSIKWVHSKLDGVRRLMPCNRRGKCTSVASKHRGPMRRPAPFGRSWTISTMLYVDLGRLISLPRAAKAAPPPRTIDGALLALYARQKVTPSFLRRSLVLENHRVTKKYDVGYVSVHKKCALRHWFAAIAPPHVNGRKWGLVSRHDRHGPWAWDGDGTRQQRRRIN